MPALFALLLIIFILYVLAGYPLLLTWLASRRSRPVSRHFSACRVSVLLAVHNGERFLAAKLDSLLALNYPPELVEIFVLDDGSTDNTAAIAARYPSVSLISLPAGGKCAALNAGLTRASGDILFFTDVRQALHADSLRHLVACFHDPKVGCVSGELIIVEGENLEQAQTGLYWRYEKAIRRAQSALDSVIGATGAIYAQRRSLCRPIPPDILLDDVYQPLNAFFSGYRIVFEPSALAYDHPTELSREFQRKVRTLAGNYQIFKHYPQLFTPSNRMLWHFLSHKFSRLMLPFALLLLLAVSFALPQPYMGLLLAGQILFYSLAWLDSLLPDSFPGKRITSPIRAFVTLMAATFCSASILFRPARSFWK